MDVLDLYLRVILSGVFGFAAFSKLSDINGFRETLKNFGCPIPIAPSLSIVFPLVELFIALLLLPATTAKLGAFASLILLIIFTIAISINLILGKHPDCNCFGQTHASPINMLTVLRNIVFTLIAIFILWFQNMNYGISAFELVTNWLYFFPTATGMLFISILWFNMHLLRQQGRLLLYIDNLELRINAFGIPSLPSVGAEVVGPQLGSIAPSFKLKNIYEEEIDLSSLLSHRIPLVLIFSDPNCSPCNELMPELARVIDTDSKLFSVVIVSRGTIEENKEKFSRYGIDAILIQEEREVAESYNSHATPSAVLIKSDGLIGSNLAIGSKAIFELISSAPTVK